MYTICKHNPYYTHRHTYKYTNTHIYKTQSKINLYIIQQIYLYKESKYMNKKKTNPDSIVCFVYISGVFRITLKCIESVLYL